MSKYDKVENATFYDGFLYIIYEKGETEMGCERMILLPECQDYDDPEWTLKKIAEKYPTVIMVIYESWLNGDVYRYGKYKPGEWVREGEMIGFA